MSRWPSSRIRLEPVPVSRASRWPTAYAARGVDRPGQHQVEAAETLCALAALRFAKAAPAPG